MRTYSTTAILVLVVAAGIAFPFDALGQPAEQVEYVARIESFHMSEGATNSLQTVALMAAGQLQVDYAKDGVSGVYSPIFSSSSQSGVMSSSDSRGHSLVAGNCTFDENAELLHSIADVDKSGFVTSEEGESLYKLCVLGRKIQAAILFEGASLEAVSEALGLNPRELYDDVTRYNRVAGRLASSGLGGLKPIAVGQGIE